MVVTEYFHFFYMKILKKIKFDIAREAEEKCGSIYVNEFALMQSFYVFKGNNNNWPRNFRLVNV
jgi:hypothetical protein